MLVAGCSAYAPELLSVRSSEIHYLLPGGEVREELILELEVRDRDGFAELDMLYLSHAGKELYWEIPAENWAADPETGSVRVSRLAAAPGEQLPRGRYTVSLYDLGGRSGEGELTLPLLPDREILGAEEERLRLAAERLVGEGAGEISELDGILLLGMVPEGSPEELVDLEELESLGPAERERRIMEAVSSLRGAGGRFYYALRVGEAGPLLLLREEFT